MLDFQRWPRILFENYSTRSRNVRGVFSMCYRLTGKAISAGGETTSVRAIY
jgi:hypothetical protein